jgi:hypothetical protein
MKVRDQLHVSVALPPGTDLVILGGQEADTVSEQVWTVWKENLFVLWPIECQFLSVVLPVA